MDDEDRDIVTGFIAESLESLEMVEASLIDLEQDASNPESINAIFRAFHTIKGVSSFLGFMRINRLAHRSENLLDKIRSGELGVDGDTIDVILDSVDLLKRLIQGVQAGMETVGPQDIGLDIVPVIRRIEVVQDAKAGIEKPLGEILVQRGAIDRQKLDAAMVPIKSTFQKMLRLVRDLTKSSRKKIQLLMSGEETEIDRNVVDELYEPMVHMIRNSVDHGLEPPEERRAAEKDASGAFHLKAYHKGGNIIVEISDDGRVDIQSATGRGTTFFITLPLTLAIIEGMLVRVGEERYVIPALSIIESFRPTAEQCSTVKQNGKVGLILDMAGIWELAMD
jgi:chemotaxis protein histidine kinase CheA